MRRARLRRLRWPLVMTAAMVIGGVVAKESGWRVNVSGSLPGILYRVVDLRQARVGDYVQFCPPKTIAALPDAIPGEPSCDGKMQLIKRVVAVAPGRVVVNAEGVWIDGVLLAHSKPKTVGSDGMPLPVAFGRHDLRPGQLWVAGDHPDSFDSRYFGPVSAD